MTSVSSSQTSALFQTQRPPPPPRGNPVAQAIASEVSTGSISATDGTALSSALDSIDSSLKSDSSSSSSTTSTRLDPSKIQDKISGLIDDQVSGGSLTSDQATTLKSLFESNAPHRSGTSASGGPDGPPPGPPPSDEDSASTSSSSSTSSTTSASDLLDSFVKALQASQTSSTGYAASGSTASSASANALLFDFST